MSFKIIIHDFTKPPFNALIVVEKSVSTSANSSGTWSAANEAHVLTMNGSGTSGCLRFVTNIGESFIATFGVDQDKPWSDIVPDLTPEETALVVHPQYNQQPDRIAIREMHLTHRTVTNDHGHNFTIDFTNAQGPNFRANLIAG